jgi:hypothetical protein
MEPPGGPYSERPRVEAPPGRARGRTAGGERGGVHPKSLSPKVERDIPAPRVSTQRMLQARRARTDAEIIATNVLPAVA